MSELVARRLTEAELSGLIKISNGRVLQCTFGSDVFLQPLPSNQWAFDALDSAHAILAGLKAAGSNPSSPEALAEAPLDIPSD